MSIQERLETYLGKAVSQASDREVYEGLLGIVQEMASEKERTDSKKKIYYISAGVPDRKAAVKQYDQSGYLQ